MTKKMKQIIIEYDDKSWKGYNLPAFLKVMGIKFEEFLKKLEEK